jgi:hypothetical protein
VDRVRPLHLAFGLAPSGFVLPLQAAGQRFTHALATDNVLPFVFAMQIAPST